MPSHPHPAMNAAPPPTHGETPAERDDRHISVCCMLTDLAAELAQAPALREEMEAQLDHELTETPEAPTPEIIRRICNGFGIHIDPDPGPGYPRRHLYAALDTG